jgi:hypothetical protein
LAAPMLQRAIINTAWRKSMSFRAKLRSHES